MLQHGCSLNHTDWKNLTSILKDTDWHFTKLNMKFQDAIPKYPGIYMFVTDHTHLSRFYNLPEGIGSVLYVGKSSNLYSRFKQHSSNAANPRIHKSKLTFGTLRFAFAKAPTKNQIETDTWLSEAEHLLILAFGPPANRTVPRGATLVGTIGQAESLK